MPCFVICSEAEPGETRWSGLGWRRRLGGAVVLGLVLWAMGVGALRGEQTGPARRVLAADYSIKRIGIVNEEGRLEWEYPVHDIHDAWLLPDGHVLFQTSWTRIVEVTAAKEVVWSHDVARPGDPRWGQVEVHSFERLADGRTLIAESGVGRLIEVDRQGAVQFEMKLKVDRPDPRRDIRLVRKLATGHYLVAQEGDGCVREYDPTGQVVWEYRANAQVCSASRLPDGHTLIGGGNSGRVLEVDSGGRLVWSVERHELKEIRLVWVTMAERLTNGNTVIVNCHAGPGNPQMVEVTPAKEVVWTFKDFEHFGNAMAVGRVLGVTNDEMTNDE